MAWFPLVISDSSGLGVNFALSGGGWGAGEGGGADRRWVASVAFDLAAIIRLDEVRTSDLTLSRKNLGAAEPGLDTDNRIF